MKRLGMIGLLIVVCFACLFTIFSASVVHSSDGSAWATPINLSDNEGEARNSLVLADKSGYVHVLWKDNAFSPYDERIYYRVRDPQDNWSPISTIPDSALEYYGQFDAVIDSQNVLHVVWRKVAARNNDRIVYYSQKAVSGDWTAPFALQELGMYNFGPIIEIGPDDTVHVTSAGIYLHRSTNNTWSEPTYPFGTFPIGAQIAVDNSGGVHAAAGDSGEVYYTNLISDTSWATPINISSNSTLSYAPSIRVDYSGRVHFWWINVTGPNRNGIFYRSLYDGILTDTITLTDVPENSNLGYIAIGQDGLVHIVSNGSYMSRNLSGVWSTPVDHNAGYSILALAPNGDVDWFWGCGDSSCHWSDLMHSRRYANGDWSSITNLGRHDSLPSVSFGVNGSAYATWPRWIEQEDDVDIFFSDYASKNVPTPTPTPTITATPTQTATPTPTETPDPHIYLPTIQN